MRNKFTLVFSFILIFSFFVNIYNSTTLYAADDEETCSIKDPEDPAICLDYFYSNNDILYYNPNAQACNVPEGNTAAIVSGSSEKNVEPILKYFTGKGMTLAAAAGLAGNMKQESGFNPAIIQGGSIAPDNYKPVNGKGFGLVQWTFGGTTGGRQGGLYELAKLQNRGVTNLNLQLDYIWKELSGPYKKSTLDRVISMTDPIEAAVIIHDNYEISADSPSTVKSVRGGNAAKYFAAFKDKITDGNAPSVYTGAQSNCSANQAGGFGISADGFVFPLKSTKKIIQAGEPKSGAKWCYQSKTNCHHTANAADISAPEGTQVVAVRGGTVVGANPSNGQCASSSIGCNLSFKGDDGVLYYYAHMKDRSTDMKPGAKITAGQTVAYVGTKAMAINTHPHIHINALPGSKYSSQPPCLKGACPNSGDYIDIQATLYEAFQKLPD